MIKILHILSSLGGGGVGKCLFNYYGYFDKNNIVFDFAVCGSKKGVLEEPLANMGSNIFHITPKKKSYVQNLRELDRIIKNGNYDIVHCHQDYHGVEAICIAKKYRVKTIISHSHIADIPENIISKLRRKITTKIIMKQATDFFACSKDAAEWLFGEDANFVYVMKNAINLDEFTFNEEIRKDMRRELKVDNKFVVGNIGRFAYQKNHKFLIEIFMEVRKIKENAVLLLAGDGALESEIKDMVEKLGLRDSVVFLGVRSDANKLLQAMDVFVFPTRYEGLGIVAVEAQTSGVKCVFSDRVPEEAIFLDEAIVLSIDKSAGAWAEEICNVSQKLRKAGNEEAEKSGYCIKKESVLLQQKYTELFRRNL